MGGIIAGFLGGAGQGAAKYGELMLRDKLEEERQEADFLRTKELKGMEFKHDDEQAETKYGRDKELKEMEIKSAEKIAGMKGKKKNPQLIKRTDSKGNEQEYILRVDDEGNPAVIDPVTGERLSAKEQENLRITKEELKNAAAQINSEEGYDNDYIPFNEVSPSDDRARARALKNRENQGIVSKAKTGQPVPAAPKPKTNPKFKEGDVVRSKKDGKLYVIKNGKPVLKEGQ